DDAPDAGAVAPPYRKEKSMVYVGGLGRTIGQRRRSGGESEVAGGRHPGEHRVPLEEKRLWIRRRACAIRFPGVHRAGLKVDPILGEELDKRRADAVLECIARKCPLDRDQRFARVVVRQRGVDSASSARERCAWHDDASKL